MAKLGTPYPFPKWEDYPDYKEYYKASDKALDEIPQDKLIQFPIADGYAFYYVKSLSPLTLQHIPYSDAWEIPYAHIRGLRKSDILAQIRYRKQLAELCFKQKNKQNSSN